MGADSLVEQGKHRGDADAFIGEAVAVRTAFGSNSPWAFIFCTSYRSRVRE
jgi:hypothetical protein